MYVYRHDRHVRILVATLKINCKCLPICEPLKRTACVESRALLKVHINRIPVLSMILSNLSLTGVVCYGLHNKSIKTSITYVRYKS